MRVGIDGVYSYGSDICCTCVKDNTECVLKKALSNYHGGGDMPFSLILVDCPEYRRTENRNDRISWYDFNEAVPRSDRVCATLNPNVTVRFNTGETDSGT